MKVKVLGASGGVCPGSDSTSLLLDNHVLLDAGTGALRMPLKTAMGVHDILLSHSHMDHTAALCFLADNFIGVGTLRIHCLKPTADALRGGIFNENIWPDMERIKINGQPLIEYRYIKKMCAPMQVSGVRVSPFPIEHPVPTLGFCLHGKKETLPVMTDLWHAKPAVWKWLAKQKHIRRIVIETSFPDSMEDIAKNSGHLTPAVLKERLKLLPPHWKVLCCHVKPHFAAKVRAEVKKHLGTRATMLKDGQTLNI